MRLTRHPIAELDEALATKYVIRFISNLDAH